jgi:magnesium transporter
MQVLTSIDRPAIERLRAADEFFWLDILTPTAEEVEEIAELFDLHPLVTEDLQKFGQRPKIDDYDDSLHIVFYGVEHYEPVEVHLIVKGEVLITVRRLECAPLHTAKDRIDALDHTREEYAVYRVLDALTDSFFPLIDSIDDAIDELEDRVVEGDDPKCLHKIVSLKGRLTDLRRRVHPQRDILATAGNLFERLPGFTEEGAHDYFRDVYDHLLRISDSIENFRDELTSMLDVYLSAQSNRLSRWVTRLTVIGTIFLPLTFLTGFFGQNFAWMEEHIKSAGTFIGLGIGLELFSIVALLVWFRRAGIRE